jgi:hypothetical protein
MGVRQKRFSALLAPQPGERLLARTPHFPRNFDWKSPILPRSTYSSKKFTLGFGVDVAAACNLLLPRAQLRLIAGWLSRSNRRRFSSGKATVQGSIASQNYESRTLVGLVHGTNWRKKARKCDEMLTASCNSCNQWASPLVTVNIGRTSLRTYSA